MPRRDGTGPMSGRGLGVCNGINSVRNSIGSGRGHRRRPEINSSVDSTGSKTQKESLQEQMDLLESRLDVISKQLENL
ncbi:MAG TPA: DUF5320 domain-containing protein [Desulfosporosinus sp.]|nr:DUF5320 domain-containing protein [Desulfosporosinus sp.]